jgi:hypothetical protein
MNYKIIKRKTGKILTENELALEIYKQGQYIIYCDIEGIAEIDGIFYLLDECGHWAYIDTSEYKLKQI